MTDPLRPASVDQLQHLVHALMHMRIDVRQHVWQRVTKSEIDIAIMRFPRRPRPLVSPLMQDEVALQVRQYPLPVRQQEFIAGGFVAPAMQMQLGYPTLGLSIV